MSRPKGNPGKRVNIYLDPKSLKIAKDIDNLSEFVQIALSQASAVYTVDMVRRARNLPPLRDPTQEEIDAWNKNHPLDPLTARRMEKQKWRNTPNSQSNPALL